MPADAPIDNDRLDDLVLTLLRANSFDGLAVTYGYARLCDILKDTSRVDEEAEGLLDWVGDDFDPEAFDAGEVKFSSAARRLKALRRTQ